LDAYRWMKSKISCWRFVNFSSTMGLGAPSEKEIQWTVRTHVRRVAAPQDGINPRWGVMDPKL
jgi:hypothetical protein